VSKKYFAALLAAAILLALVPSVQLVSAGWLSGWNYRRAVTVTAGSSGMPADYQLRIVIDTASLISAGKMRSDGGDIRFTKGDGTTLLSYWVESGINTSSTVVWVKDPDSLSANASHTLYLYYGNPSATSASNGNAVFEFFDDFDDGIIDTNKWQDTVYSGTSKVSETGGVLRVYFNGAVQERFFSKNLTFGPGYAIEVMANETTTGNSFTSVGFYTSANAHDRLFIGDGTSSNDYAYVGAGWSGSYTSTSTGINTTGSWHKYKILWESYSKAVFFIDSSTWTITTNIPQSALPACFRISADSAYTADTDLYDNFFVRKYVSPESTASIGAEESAPPPTVPPNPPTSLLTEGQTNPTRLTTFTPRFSAIGTDNNGDQMSYYALQVSTDSTFSTITHWNQPKTAITPFNSGTRCPDITYTGVALSRGVTYYWRIKFWDSTGLEGAWSTETAYFRINQLPTAPTSLTLNTPKVGETLTATASGSTDPDGDTITYYYRFYNQTDGVERKAYSTSNTYTIATADAHDNIRVFAKAYDGYEFSAEIESSIIVANSLPTTTNLKTEGQTNPTRLTTFTPTFSWTYSDADGDTQNKYEIWVGTTSGSSDMWNSGQVSSSATSATYAGAALSRGVTYYVQVRTFDGYDWSSWATGTFRINQLPTTTNLKTQGQTNPTRLTTFTPTFSWTFSDADGDAQSKYEIWVGTSSGGNNMWNSGQVSSSSNSATYAGSALSRGVTYYVQVRTFDGYEWSSWVTGTFRLNQLPVASSPAAQKTTLSWQVQAIERDPSLVLCLPFDEGSGTTAKDFSGYGNNGTLYGPTWVDGKYGKALSFDGVDDKVAGTVSNLINDATAHTVSAWVYLRNLPRTGIVVANNGAWKGFSLEFRTTWKMVWLHGNGTNSWQSLPSNTTFSANRWYHLAGVLKADRTVELYVNGVLDASGTIPTYATYPGATWYIGRNMEADNLPINGIIDEVRVYNRALSAEEIKQQYLLGLPRHIYQDAISGEIYDSIPPGSTVKVVFPSPPDNEFFLVLSTDLGTYMSWRVAK